MARDGFYLHIEGWEKFDRAVDFDKKPIRRAMHAIGKRVQGRAQLNVSLAGGAHDYPRVRTGALRDAIRYRVSRSGFLTKVMPNMPAGSPDYYPAYLYYGVKRQGKLGRLAPGQGLGQSNRRARGQRQRELDQRRSGPWRIAPRANYIVDALEDETPWIERALSNALRKGLRPK